MALRINPGSSFYKKIGRFLLETYYSAKTLTLCEICLWMISNSSIFLFSDYGLALVFHVALILWIQSHTNVQIARIFLEDTKVACKLPNIDCHTQKNYKNDLNGYFYHYYTAFVVNTIFQQLDFQTWKDIVFVIYFTIFLQSHWRIVWIAINF